MKRIELLKLQPIAVSGRGLRRNKFLFLKKTVFFKEKRGTKKPIRDHAISFQNAQVKACTFHSLHLD